MNIPSRKVVSTVIGILIVIAVVIVKGGNRNKLDKENTQYYQLDELNHANECREIHNQLVDFMVDAQPIIQKGKSVPLPDHFDTLACGRLVDVHGQIPALHDAEVAYLNEYKAITSNIDTDGDHKVSPQEFDVLVDKYDLLYQKGMALKTVYDIEEEKWYKARLETVGSDHARRHIHWVYTLALDINAITRNLCADKVDVDAAEKSLANLKQNVAEMKEDMDDSSWAKKETFSSWVATIPEFLQAAETRLDFVKTKAATATDEQKEDSIETFKDASINDQPTHFEDTFVVPSTSPSRHHHF